MLQKLRIKNVILIESAEIEFAEGLNVLTGETGAGKSIIVDCLMLLFGARYDKSLLRYGAEEGFVEGVFSLSDHTEQIMSDMGLEGKGTAVIKRRFTAEGKSDIKINGQTVTGGMLKKFMASLIDIYGQHDFQKLYEPGSELAQIDYYARHGQGVMADTLSEKCQKYRETVKSIKDLGDAGQREREIDYLNYQIAEIASANIHKTEEEELVAARRKALNHEKIADALREAVENLAGLNVARAVFPLKKIEALGQDVRRYIERLDSCLIELDDISASVKSELRDLSVGADDIEKIEKRLSLIRGIIRKYGDFDRLTKFFESAKTRLETLAHGEESYRQLLLQKERELKEIYDLSADLSQKRRAAAAGFVAKINTELSGLGMQNAELNANFADFPAFDGCEKYVSDSGMDDMHFTLRTNAGQPFMPLLKIISGGEMSRFMLAIKAVSGDADKIPTLIFDEIDNGISGKVGQEVAKKLAKIALNCQILCVTHLPQIAAMADAHFAVKKEVKKAEIAINAKDNEGDTVTFVESLTRNGMIDEIARLSGGAGISKSSVDTASEIKNWCDEFKSHSII
ncbi:MAG: DNA repair protein RecN [Firmicutes bacterium]|nr:DNA repair protein RecN [Bacillota bacterium]